MRFGGVAGFLALAVVALLAGPGQKTSNAVEVTVPQMQVVIDNVTPLAPDRDSTLTVTGRVVNTGAVDVPAAAVTLRFSEDPLVSRSEVTPVLDGSTERFGQPVRGTKQKIGGTLAPGDEAEFKIRTKMSGLGLKKRPAVYPAFVVATASGDQVARGGLLVPWFLPDGKYRPSRLALAWPVLQRPAVAADNLVLDPELVAEFGAGGRLDRLVSAAGNADVAWLVDPAVLETSRRLADEYRVATPNGRIRGDRTAQVARFSEQLGDALEGKSVALTGYAQTDVTALNRADLTSLIARSATLSTAAGKSDLKDANTHEMFAAPGGYADPGTIQALVDAGVPTVLMSDAAFPPDTPINYTPTGATTVAASGGSVEVLLSDTRLDRALTGDLTTAADRSLVSRTVLGELAMIALERPESPRQIVVRPPDLWDPPGAWSAKFLKALTAAPWVDLIGFDEVDAGGTVPRSLAASPPKVRPRPLPKSYLRQIVGLENRLGELSGLVDDPIGFGTEFILAFQRASSALWRGQRPDREQMVSTIGDQLDAEEQKVRVISGGNVTLAGDNGVLPLTVANDLDRSVTVGLELQTQNPIRLRYQIPEPVQVDAGQKAGLEIPIKVVGSQPMEVTVVLTDRQGMVHDSSAKLQVKSTAASRVAAIVAGAGALGFVLLVGLRLYRRRRSD